MESTSTLGQTSGCVGGEKCIPNRHGWQSRRSKVMFKLEEHLHIIAIILEGRCATPPAAPCRIRNTTNIPPSASYLAC
jgi:hypothetical protein